MAAKKPKGPVYRVSVGAQDTDKSKFAKVLWAPQPGPQTEAMLRPEFEIFLGGARGGGKSYLGIGWLIKGNPDVPTEQATPIDISYVNCPSYRALALRVNLIDLESWRDEAMPIYKAMGAEFRQNPDEFIFPSGAKIILGHLDASDAVYKYFGQVVHRVFLDELTFIADVKIYKKLMSCVRSSIPGIRPQMLLTSNPGSVGHNWVQARFVNPIDEHGNEVPPRTSIVERSFNPFLKRKIETSRVYIPARLSDNKILLESDPTYYDRLTQMDDAERRAYLEGDWNAFLGSYFAGFRNVHRLGEPPEACHVVYVGETRLAPHWPRWIGVDWGFKHCSAVYWACQDPNGQVIIYHELVGSEISAIELGMAIASNSLEDLKGLEKKNMILYLSPDAFAKRDETNTIAEMITSGIRRILGSDGGYIIDSDRDPGGRIQGRASIGVTRAQSARILGWQHMRELMRWKRPEISGVTESKREPLPKLLISDKCTRLIRAIPTATYDKDGEDVLKTDSADDDVLDSCFIAGTLVTTARGDIPIETVGVGDKVLTRNGLMNVSAAGITNQKAHTISVDFSGGSRLTGTTTHPVYVSGLGFVPIGDLQCGQQVLTLSAWCTKESYSGAIQNLNVDNFVSTFIRRPTTSARELAHCIARFGKMLTGLFQMAVTSITKMATQATMPLRIWSALAQCSISTNILPMNGASVCARLPIPIGISQKRGTLLRKGENGIANTQKLSFGKLGRIRLSVACDPSSVNNAARLTRHQNTAIANSVQISASRPGEEKKNWTSLKRLVQPALQYFRQTSTTASSAALTHVLRKCEAEIAPVYNLTVDNCPEYFANGILVHNCRYLLAAHKFRENQVPYERFFADRMDDAKTRHPEGMDGNMEYWVAQKIQKDFEHRNSTDKPMLLPRASSRRYKMFDRAAFAREHNIPLNQLQ